MVSIMLKCSTKYIILCRSIIVIILLLWYTCIGAYPEILRGVCFTIFVGGGKEVRRKVATIVILYSHSISCTNNVVQVITKEGGY